MAYGDVLTYRDDPTDGYRFMEIGIRDWHGRPYKEVMVLVVPADDDQWETGTILISSIDEMEVVPE